MQSPIVKYSGPIAIAIAGLFAGSAQAAIPAVSASFYISGASAARAIPPAIATELCNPAINDRADYIDNATSINYRINVCTLKNTTEVPSSIRGLKVAFYSRSQGGTLFGIRGIAVPQAIKFIDGSTCPADDGDPATQQLCPTLTADADYTVPDGVGDGHRHPPGLRLHQHDARGSTQPARLGNHGRRGAGGGPADGAAGVLIALAAGVSPPAATPPTA